MPTAGPIALFDSGEGGLTVLRHLVERFPQEQFLYAGDSEHFPYGEKSLDDVRDWFLTFVDFFLQKGARAIIIACNTATAAALPAAKRQYSIPIVGVVEAAVSRALELTRNGRIGVLCTEATYNSGLYPRELKAVNPTLEVTVKPCPILVQMVESGHTDGKPVEDEVRQCVGPVLDHDVDTIILGCTHFPHMRDVFNRVVGQDVFIVDPGEEIVEYLPFELDLAQGNGIARPVLAWTSGDPAQFARVTAKLCPQIPMVSRSLKWNGQQLAEETPVLALDKGKLQRG